MTLDTFADTIKAGQTQELRVVVKADVQGSMDVLVKSLEEIGNDEVTVRVIHSAVGGISESDVLLADASDAIVIGFHVTATPAVREIAERLADIRRWRKEHQPIGQKSAGSVFRNPDGDSAAEAIRPCACGACRGCSHGGGDGAAALRWRWRLRPGRRPPGRRPP